jgi:hypothetical protein
VHTVCRKAAGPEQAAIVPDVGWFQIKVCSLDKSLIFGDDG